MIGQKNLLFKLTSYTIDTFPRSVILIGEKGVGKHTLTKYIQQTIIKLPLIDITIDISDEYLDAIYRNPNPSIYLIDLCLITEKEQNVLLKFIEEPLNNSFIIILAENKNTVLNTVLNRCIAFEFEAYTKDELASFLTNEQDKELILDIVRTPGKILNTNINNIKDMINVSEKICTKLANASYTNTLTIVNKINLKDNYDKFDIEIFFDILCKTMFFHYLDTNDNEVLSMYYITKEYRKKLLDKRLNKELFFENYLTKLWKLVHQN